MVFELVCQPVAGERLSELAVPRVASACLPDCPARFWTLLGILPLNNRDRQMTPPHRATFPVCARLTKPIEFKRVFRKSTVSSDHLFKVLARSNRGHCSRLGMAVSRKVDRHAVGRNRIKRIIRESFRQSFRGLTPSSHDPVKNDSNTKAVSAGYYPGIDFVVLPRRQATTTCNHRLFQSLQAHWLRLKQETG